MSALAVSIFATDAGAERRTRRSSARGRWLSRGEAATAPLHAIGSPILDISGPGPYCAWQAGFDPFLSRGPVLEEIYACWKALYLGRLSDEHIDQLAQMAGTMPSEECLIAIWHLGGAMARVPEDATTFGKREAPTCSALTVAGRIAP